MPSPAEVDEFLADRAPDKHARLVDRLLASPEFVDHWAYKWGDLLRIESGRLGAEGAAAFHGWVRDAVARNTPLDRMAREMILALGDGDRVGPANFSRVASDARSQAELVSQAFLGVRLQCANCHDHPLDRWTRDDYHGLAAVFARVDRGRTVRLRERGEVIHPGTGLAASPRIPGERPIPGDGDPREAFAEWLTAPENPYFARAAVNRIWRELMGRGLVEPVDDHRATNPPTHPALLDVLARDLVAHGFDTRHTIRTILASEAYRRESRPVPGSPDDDRFYSHALARPLPPHVLVDAVARVTGVPEPLGDLPARHVGGLAGGFAGRVGAAGPARPLPPGIRLRPGRRRERLARPRPPRDQRPVAQRQARRPGRPAAPDGARGARRPRDRRGVLPAGPGPRADATTS